MKHGHICCYPNEHFHEPHPGPAQHAAVAAQHSEHQPGQTEDQEPGVHADCALGDADTAQDQREQRGQAHVAEAHAGRADEPQHPEERPRHDQAEHGTQHLVELAWHIGNRHTPCQIEGGRLLIRRDHVMETMLRGLGASVSHACEPFTPEGGAYGHGRTMGHDHGDGGDHGHAHGHGHVHHHGGHTHPDDPEPERDPE